MVIRPPWLGGGRCYPGFLSGTCRLALVGLRCSWSSRWGHLSQVGTVFFLSPRSCRTLSLLLVGLVPGLSAGSPASGWRCVLRHALVLEAVPPSHRLVLLLCTGFLFSGPCWCGRLHPFPSPMYSFGLWSPFESLVSFCHSCSRTKIYIGGCFFSDIATHFGVESSYLYVLIRFVGTSGSWWPRFSLASHCSLPVGCLLLTYSAA